MMTSIKAAVAARTFAAPRTRADRPVLRVDHVRSIPVRTANIPSTAKTDPMTNSIRVNAFTNSRPDVGAIAKATMRQTVAIP